MGSLLLVCPLCCSETFTCHNSLKYHLLSVSENLACPACEKRFEKVFDLAMHLGRRCADSEQEIMDFELSSDETSLSNNDEEIIFNASDGDLPSTEVKMLNNHCSVEAPLLNNCKNESLLERALLRSPDMEKTSEDITIEDETEGNEDQQLQEDIYYCSSCNINFTSVESHIQEFHEGQEVFIEEANEDSTNITNAMSEEEVEESYLDNDECDDGKDILNEIKNTELLDTVQEEECVDINGRLYTRKVVKIDKFWDDKSKDSLHQVSSNVGAVQEDVVFVNVNSETDNSENNNSTILEFYQCSNCAKKFESIDDYADHRCSDNPEENTKFKKCRICKGTFINSEYLEAHMKMHKRKDADIKPPFICKICNTEFTTYKSLRLHKRMHEPIKSKNVEPPVFYGLGGERLAPDAIPREMFMCKICNKPYNKEYKEVHLKSHSKEPDFTCDICNRKFYSSENLTMHLHAHSDQKKFICEYCKKSFLTNDKLKAHMSGKCQKREYECQYCGRRFSRPHEKVKHERIHTGEKPHICEVCGKSFRVSYCLTLHMRTHSGKRPYKCEHCGKRFKAHSVYNHHLLTHSEDRKYKCPFCPKRFKTGVQLAGHKNSHTKPFICTECNRPFSSLYAVRGHMETHQRQNNLKYKCWICGASYARSFALRDHVRGQHINHDEADKVDPDAIIETDDYDAKDIETREPMLGDADETMLLDIGTETVCSMELHDVQVEADVKHDIDI